MAKQLTVAQLLPDLESGGVETGTLEIARGLVARGHRSLVVSGGGKLTAQLQAEGSKHVTRPIGHKSLATLRQVRWLRRWLVDEGVDILHARSRLPAWVAYLAWRRMPPAQRPYFITTVHGLHSVSRYSNIMNRGQTVIAVSQAARDYVLLHYPKTDPEAIQVIHRGIDHQLFRHGYQPDPEWLRAWYTQYPQLRGKQVLTLPGRLTRLKGHLDFIKILDRVRRDGSDAYGLIVGDQDPRRQAYAEEVRAAVAASGLSQQLLFTGHRQDMRDIYAVSDIVLSLSNKPESFGRTALEALSLGVPVVGYAHGGIGEILDSLFPQGRVPLGDVAAAVAQVQQFLHQAPTVARSDRFDLPTLIDREIDLYEACAARR